MMCKQRKHVGVTKTRMKSTEIKQQPIHTTRDSALSGKSFRNLSFLFFFFLQKKSPLLYDPSMFTLRGFPAQTQGQS